MKQVEERYISLLTDFGFKRIFGTAMNKDLLICFLNSLFNGRQVVKDVSYLNPEHVGDVYTDRRAIFDVYCEGENGEKFIVEMQNAYQTYFKDRALFYSTFPIREQAPKGSEWDFKLNHVYTIALLNFSMNGAGEHTIAAKVDVSEMMGSEIHLHVNAGGKDVVLRIPTTELAEEQRGGMGYGTELHFTFREDLVHLFDPETGKNLL